MSQISRPFQILLLVFGVLALVWLFALQGRPSSSSSTPTAAPVVSAAAPAAPSAAEQAQAAAAPSSVYHGAAPGVQGLSGAINKAHGAVATSQSYANKIEQKSNQASGQSAPATTSGAPASKATSSAPSAAVHTAAPVKTAPTKHAKAPVAPVVAHKPATAKAVAPHHTTKLPSNTLGATHAPPKTSASPTHGASSGSVPAGQRAIEAQLSRGNVVALLFWNPQNPADASVRQELQLLVKVHSSPSAYNSNAEVERLFKAFHGELHKRIALDEASASQVTDYGAITHGIQVYNTPTP